MAQISISHIRAILAVRRVVVLASLGKITLAAGTQSIKVKAATGLLWIAAQMKQTT